MPIAPLFVRGGTKGTAPLTAKRHSEQFSFKLGFVPCGTERNGHKYVENQVSGMEEKSRNIKL